MSTNQLANEKSPYLLLHKENPVHWQPWNADAFSRAEAENKPILLSIGYTACHWCHVMNEESFTDRETAALMNDLFVNVKVDREERPDIDQIYQAAATSMGHTGGWPLTMFLTPKGVPYWVTGFLPKEERLGMPAFSSILNQASKLYREQPDTVAQSSDRVSQQLNTLWNRDMRGTIDASLLDSSSIRIGQRFDLFFGGLLGTTKFPSTMHIEVLVRAYLRSGMPQFIQIASTTMDSILLGGLYDHLGGGFYRYCVDERWLVPHFEKMLYDNAMILDQIIHFWQLNRNPIIQQRIEDSVAFLLRDMKVGDAFASSIDADSEGEEGKYYLWSEAEIDAALKGTFAQRFKLAYNVRREGPFQGRNVLQRIGSSAPYPQSDADEALLKKQRELLLAARQTRQAPFRDNKVLADWNGLAIAALANAGAVLRRSDWTNAAIAAFEFIVKTLSDGDRLAHVWHDGKRGDRAFADDYAHMIRAALILWETVGDKRYLDYAKRWTHTMNEHYWDNNLGGYFFTSDDTDSLIVRTRMLFDQPVPSGNSIMISQLIRLYQATTDTAYAQRADLLCQAFATEAARAYPSCPTFFASLETAIAALQIVVVGPLNNAKTHELVAAIQGRCLPNKLLVVASPDEPLPEGHPAFGKGLVNGQPAAYVCQRGTCSPPITNPVTLSQALQLPVRPAQGQQVQ
jgi:uncharacterized protein YyaL (SSP411 family)